MKTKEQIEAMAFGFGHELNARTASGGLRYCAQEGFKAGYEQAQKDAQEREAKLVEVIMPILEITDRKHDLWVRARAVLKELGLE